ncbi:hypothetical protein [Dubosiella newyorkensis]|uniref:hypothetical protein n=2 Tax=Dubosiella newyorkensis TaxID=1862672 RepID=UPI00272A46AB|nr:hypothetical protein [Dubosiella newyorkensis]
MKLHTFVSNMISSDPKAFEHFIKTFSTPLFVHVRQFVEDEEQTGSYVKMILSKWLKEIHTLEREDDIRDSLIQLVYENVPETMIARAFDPAIDSDFDKLQLNFATLSYLQKQILLLSMYEEKDDLEIAVFLKKSLKKIRQEKKVALQNFDHEEDIRNYFQQYVQSLHIPKSFLNLIEQEACILYQKKPEPSRLRFRISQLFQFFF